MEKGSKMENNDRGELRRGRAGAPDEERQAGADGHHHVQRGMQLAVALGRLELEGLVQLVQLRLRDAALAHQLRGGSRRGRPASVRQNHCVVDWVILQRGGLDRAA